jgi:hypothetical protein
MHPPSFHASHTIADWPECHLDARCPGCAKTVVIPLRMLRLDFGGARILDIVAKLRCHSCGVKPAPVHLCASPHRTFLGGPQADWAIELVAAPKG